MNIGRFARAVSLCLGAMLVVALGASSARAAGVPARVEGEWTLLGGMPGEVAAGTPWIRAERYQALRLDVAAMKALLSKAPQEDVAAKLAGQAGAQAQWMEMKFPGPDGVMARFRVAESSIMEGPLQAKFPEIRTYVGQGVDDPWATMRMSMTPLGLSVQVLSPTTGAWYIDVFTKGDIEYYSSYWRRDLAAPAEKFQCLTPHADGVARFQMRGGSDLPAVSGATRKQYRLAVAAAGEYTSFFGGTVANGLAAVVAVVNRVNGIYELELAVRLVLVANNDQVIFTNASTDPFTNPGANTTTLNAGQSAIRNAAGIGTAGFDVGHTFVLAANAGVAGAIGNVCLAPPTSLTSNGSGKGRGVTGLTSPVGDAFAVDYVAHELGHQFGGRHCFNNCSGGPGDAASVAVEPGSGSTIMGYAGICPGNDLQAHSDPYFNSLNIDQIITYIGGTTGNSCAAATATGNTPPAINAGADFTIPISTPYVLTPASASDANGDAISYCWEQQNGGTTDALPVNDFGDNPLSRSFLPTIAPTRTVPRLAELLANTTPIGEALPTMARTMLWRCTVRDNRAGGGGVNADSINVTTVATAGPFAVTSPNGGQSLNGTINVTWNVANTNIAPISTANVRILLSTDGGNTFPTTLAASVPNNGSASVTLPAVPTTTARIKIEAIGNIYFDISNSNFTINPPAATPNLVSGGATTISDALGVGNGNGNGVIDPGESTIRVFVPVSNTGTSTATGVSGTLVSLTGTVSVATATAAYPNVALSAVQSNSTPFVITVSPAHVCGATISLRLDLTHSGGSNSITITLPTGTGSGPSVTCAAPAVATGACCRSSQTCSILAFSPCLQVGGSYRGDNTTCTPGLCVPPVGACCVGSDCTIDGSDGCLAIEGVYQGTGTTCTPNPCPQPTGSCCSGDGSCQVLTQANCSTTWTLAGVCSPNTCAQPTGSCCASDGSCAVATQANCASTWTIAGVCSPNTCVQPTGSCCALDGSCAVTTQANCSATWTVSGVCSPNTCAQPTGSCCAAAGTCAITTQANCAAAWTVSGVCSPNTCPQPSGSCCATDGLCTVTTQASCSAAWTLSGACVPNICPQPTGVCCSGSTCLITLESACGGLNQRWLGASSACNVTGNQRTPCCKADFDQNGAISIDDLFVFINQWFANNPQAAIGSNGGAFTVDDIFVYINTWFGGCP